MIRLDKYLCDMQLGTRSEIKKAAAKGRIMLNERPCKDTSVKIEPGKDIVTLDSKMVNYEKYQYYLFYKPYGCITACEDGRQKVVMDYLKDAKGKGLSPVGRLDKDTEGLLIITNDGRFSHNLLSPAHHVDKTYYAVVRGNIRNDVVNQFEKGVDIKEKQLTRPAKLEILTHHKTYSTLKLNALQQIPTCFFEQWETENKDMEVTEINVTISEGKYHQVKRMFRAAGSEVLYLKRLRMGKFVLPSELAPGTYRPFTKQEITYAEEYQKSIFANDEKGTGNAGD